MPDAAGDEWKYQTCGFNYVAGHFSACNLEHPPLAKIILGIGLHLFGDTLTTGRVVVGAFSVATAVVLYLLLRDIAGWGWGLVGAALWGLTPQAGVENGTMLEVFRISRFGLLDPFMCFFFALALLTGWRYLQRGGRLWPFLLGFACVAAACSKEVGVLIAPTLIGGALYVRMRWHRRHIRDEVAWLVGGGVVAFVASYALLGVSGTWSEISYMIQFQLAHAHIGTTPVFNGHIYLMAPWWSNFRYAIDGLTWPLAILFTIAGIAGLIAKRWVSLYALAPSLLIYLVTAHSHLSYPYYWIDCEPGIIVAVTVGLAYLYERRTTRGVTVVAGGAVVGVLGVVLFWGIVTATPGPYRTAARHIQCAGSCEVFYVGYEGILQNYVPGIVTLARPDGSVEIFRSADSSDVIPFAPPVQNPAEPNYVVIDPRSPLGEFTFRKAVDEFEARASLLGYRKLPTAGRLLIWKKTASSPG